MLELTPMANAVRTLTESLAAVEEWKDKLPKPLWLLVQRGLIQTFEYNYILAVATLTRFLDERLADDKHDLSDFRELIRVADEHRLVLSTFATWKDFRQARNMTSHTYNDDKASTVLALIPAFEIEVVYLLARLQERVSP